MDKLEQQFFKQQAREDLLAYAVYCDRFFEIAPHHILIAEHLDKLVKGEIQNLIISMPPRAWKSRLMQEFISKLYWDYPKTDILYTWHSLNLLEGFSRNIRNRIQTREYQSLYNTKISGDSWAVKNWNVDKGGEFAIYWVWWGITGKWGNILIIDDPYASRQDAESDTIRRTVSNWYWSTLLTRKQDDKAKQILIMQRWREDDLAWEILEREPDKWVELKIPALNDNEESFWASRFSSDYFKELRANNPLFFSSQYQQDPINEQWGEFRRDMFIYYDRVDFENARKHLETITFVDPAISEKQDADNTAIVTIWIDRRNNFIYVLECIAERMLPDKIIDTIFQTQRKWWSKVGIEEVQYQKMLILEVQKQMRVRNTFFTLEWVKPQWEKVARIRSTLQGRYSSGSMLHNNSYPELEAELLKFPNGKHDDRIDALTWAVALSQTYTTWDDYGSFESESFL